MDPQRPAPEPSSEKPSPAPKPAASKATWFLRRAIGSLPEAEQFENVQQRDEVIGEINREASRLGSLDMWIGSAIIAAGCFGTHYVARRMTLLVSWPPVVEKLLIWFAVLAAFFGISWILWRWGTREELRERLIARGIPVCRGCGYSLRGLSPESSVCPECGRALDADVAAAPKSRSDAR